jgi:enoyl-[acyl-carrier-protein] reductase (NADH)
MGLLDGKKGLIVGMSAERTISWSIAQALRAKGTELGFTYRYSLTPTRHPNGLARDLPIRF